MRRLQVKKIYRDLVRIFIPARFRPIGYLTDLTQRKTDCTVLQGVFAGMKYVQDAQKSAYIPKLLGIYERELVPQIEELTGRHPKLIVVLGAAEGYYAVGLACCLPDAKVIAFEMESYGREALREMAVLNEVDNRLEIRGKCETSDLLETMVGETESVVVCDVEGYEEKLLNPDRVPQLCNAAILVESHDFIIPDISETIKRRFSQTHRITQVLQEPRLRSEFPWRTLMTTLLPGKYLDWAVDEWRPTKMTWLWMVPK
jgi:hypothetical protein